MTALNTHPLLHHHDDADTDPPITLFDRPGCIPECDSLIDYWFKDAELETLITTHAVAQSTLRETRWTSGSRRAT